MGPKDMTREQLLELSIYELREVGRQIGIRAPTIGNKSELIERIITFFASGGQPAAKSKRGRPPRQYFGMAKSLGQNETDAVQPEAPSPAAEQPHSLDAANNGYRKHANTSERSDYQRPERNEFQRSERNDYQRPERVNNYEYQRSQESAVRKVRESEGTDYLGDDKLEERTGLLDIHPDGYGFLRVKNCEYHENDVYVATTKIKRLNLRRGDMIKGLCRVNYDGKTHAITEILTINGIEVGKARYRPYFDDLIPVFPNQRLHLESADTKNDFATRCIDLLAPIGKGQRGLIVSPPKAGKTTLLKKIANGITTNHPDVLLYILLIDERPEEVTDMQRSTKGEVVYSTFDESPEHHIMAAELLLSSAKRQVELGRDVVILMDSLTRLTRAYNTTVPTSGKTLSGGIDPLALQSPKKFFGAARNIENGGSLTIIASALVDTGSRMDDVIYEEFKGTGNMEIHLDRRLQEKRIFPAIDMNKSGTRREDLLLSPMELDAIWKIRRFLGNSDTAETAEKIITLMLKTKNNEEFVVQFSKQSGIVKMEAYSSN